MNKEDTTSPNVATESVFITSTIYAFEIRILVTMDVPSSFLHTLMDPKDPNISMALQGKPTDLMVNFYTKFYRKFFSTDSKGRMILYVEIQKALYGMLKSALMLYMKLVGYLKK